MTPILFVPFIIAVTVAIWLGLCFVYKMIGSATDKAIGYYHRNLQEEKTTEKKETEECSKKE